ncbi:TetR/AcrR family transcriptional regulator [Rhizobium sp. S163]|uniref:TetR/AcrR family transcriptional regulator n=1 Tax=Rhizobium sp. S163 TaxID=3055039 RepID=UPI0025A93513|nr:TetR/AcrR family transcriptional regulator [Rhizobium sp. S163]MDM9649415.1 TetR/AcrR family transcriptional regulator [Rhizobium sp. S163]
MSDLSTTSDKILSTAQSLILSGGYNGFSFANIAELVGIRKASIFYHFSTKADLVRTLVSRYRKDAQEGVVALELKVPEPRQLLNVYVDHWAECIEDTSRPFCVCALLASELPSLPPEVATEVTSFFQFVSKWLTSVMERGAQDGTLSLTSAPDAEAEAFMACVHGAMLSARAYQQPAVFSTVLAPTLKRLSRTAAQ